MKCPICNQEMEVVAQNVSINDKTGQEYDRTIFHCLKDDTWGNVEIPKQKNLA